MLWGVMGVETTRVVACVVVWGAVPSGIRSVGVILSGFASYLGVWPRTRRVTCLSSTLAGCGCVGCKTFVIVWGHRFGRVVGGYTWGNSCGVARRWMESNGMDSLGLGPFRLAPWFSPRPWGRLDLRPWYVDTGTTEPVGEAWLTGPESVVETGAMAGQTLAAVTAEAGEALLGALDQIGGPEFPLLVKLLFPNDKLSVQVHPDDAHAQAMGQPRGKTECWYVLEAKPGATIALGLREGATVDAVRAAIAAGTLEELLQWVPVQAGDMVFVD